MTEIRSKDKVFVAAVIPLALAAAYWFAVHNDLAAKVSALKSEVSQLVSAEDFDFELSRAKRTAAEAAKELATEKAIPMPNAKVKADPKASEAAREAELLAVFRRAGLTIVSGVPVSENRSSKASDALRATGVCPEPIRRAYVLEGRYPQVLAALDAIATEEMAVLVVRIASPSSGHWEMEVVL